MHLLRAKRWHDVCWLRSAILSEGWSHENTQDFDGLPTGVFRSERTTSSRINGRKGVGMANNILRRESPAPLLEVDDWLRGEPLTNFKPGKE
ncbi:hypothetical protein EB233_30750 [Mesorhizobium erdmanii]|uniref:Uncharacterized protein n=1 Tax=Mesorhizobium erdmanii TaxID=1777866 RepID=A0A6M7UQX1_9HYPH|nr:hypothetical protein EB233_30750 [Mesorhizobium erdmanii]